MKFLKYTLITFIVVIPCIITILIYNDKITQNSPVYYKQGVEFYDNGDYSNAYYNFGKIKKFSPLHSIALYKQAKSAQKVGDYSMAALKYRLFLEKNENSIFAQTARFNLAKCYFYLKKYPEAKAMFIESKNKNKEHDNGEDYYLGLIEKSNNKNQAAQYFVNYLSSTKIEDKINEAAATEELSSIGRELTLEEKELIGKIHYKNKKYAKAIEYLSTLPMDCCWDYLVLANHNAGNKVIAKKLIENGIIKYTNKIEKENLYKIYDIYATYLQGKKLKNWTTIHDIVVKNNLNGEDYVLYKIAEISPQIKAQEIYKQIIEKFPKSDFAPESIWNVFWTNYKNKNYQEAEKLAYKHLKTYRKVNSTTRIAFWLAKTEFKLNKISEGNNILSRLVTKFPDDYYGLRAESILNKKNNFWQTETNKKLPLPNEEMNFPITLSHLDIKDLKLINTLFEMGDYSIWLDANFDNKIVESWFELRKDKKARSAVLAREAIKEMDLKPSFLSAAYKLAYPRHWTEEINIAGEKLGLDPYFVIALIKEESHFDENAKSKTNATGLMQLMPNTANYMISKLSLDFPALATLDNPRTNIYLGCNYLRYLKDRFDNNDLFVTAAYNGGEGSVSKWIKQYGTEDYDEFIENIPFDETRHYVKKVFRSYHLYKKIYE